ncbi:hypothetical protein MHYP_G00310910 [Metynnis hypsauchen]
MKLSLASLVWLQALLSDADEAARGVPRHQAAAEAEGHISQDDALWLFSWQAALTGESVARTQITIDLLCEGVSFPLSPSYTVVLHLSWLTEKANAV